MEVEPPRRDYRGGSPVCDDDRVFVKVCGLTDVAIAQVAVEAGADAIGVVISSSSPRHVEPEQAARVVASVPAHVTTVLVTAELPAAEAATIASGIGVSVLQLHGRYTREEFDEALGLFPRLWRATSLERDTPLDVGAWREELLLLDAPKPGSGQRWDLAPLLARRPAGNWLLAGGLTPANVAEAIATARPYGVDVSSGVESSPGVKDPALVRAFVTAAKVEPTH